MTATRTFSFGLLAGIAILFASEAQAEPTASTGPGPGVLQADAERGSDTLFMNSDGSYENGYAWRTGGVAPPYYGAFAERYSGTAQVVSVVLDLSQIGSFVGQTLDTYVWDDNDGVPGAVNCVDTDVHPGEIAFWPSVSRHELPIGGCFTSQDDPTGDWWVGYWGNWPDQVNGFFIGADTDGPTRGGTMTNIAPGVGGYPSGWNDVSIPWGETQALGIGAVVIEDFTPPPPTTLQGMIALAQNGETVLVPPGEYKGIGNKRLDFQGKDIVLKAEGGPAVTFINCENNGRAFHFESGEPSTAIIEGFTIRNGAVLGQNGKGGAILVENGSSPTIRDCVIEDCVANSGGAFEVVGGGIQIEGTRILDCASDADSEGGGLKATDGSVLLVDVDFEGSNGGAILLESSSATIKDCEFRGSDNSAGGGGHIRLLAGSTLALEGSLLSGAKAMNGGAIAVDPTSSATILTSSLASNNVTGFGGAIWAQGAAEVIVERSIIRGNCAATGPEIHAGSSADVTLSCSAIDATGVSGPVTYLGDQVFEDPLFCDTASCLDAPTTLGNYHLSEDSPALPVNSPCESLLGPLWIRCPFPQIPTGACCLDTGECFMTVASLCDPFGGGFLGDGSACPPGECSPATAGNPRFEIASIGTPRPNPARDMVTLAIDLQESSELDAQVFDVAGRSVRLVYSGELSAGPRELRWDGKDEAGREVSNGMYFIRVRTAEGSATRSVVIDR